MYPNIFPIEKNENALSCLSLIFCSVITSATAYILSIENLNATNLGLSTYIPRMFIVYVYIYKCSLAIRANKAPYSCYLNMYIRAICPKSTLVPSDGLYRQACLHYKLNIFIILFLQKLLGNRVHNRSCSFVSYMM